MLLKISRIEGNMKAVRIEYTEKNGNKALSGLVKVKDANKQLSVYDAEYSECKIVDNGEEY